MIDETISAVNILIKKSFGPFHRGDYSILGGFDGSLVVQEKLEVIATSFTMLDPQFGGGVRGLLNCDGSTIVVIKKFETKARKYAELYRRQFGKETSLRTVPNFENLLLGYYIGSGSPALIPID
ncbi:MAG: hypothetical protein Q7R54_00590 [bacterium]|nr:hypothetical protein [bacterium]